MFDINPICTIKIDKENFKNIFGDNKTKYFSGCKPDLSFLRGNILLNNLACDESGIDFKLEVITPLEDLIFTSVEFISV